MLASYPPRRHQFNFTHSDLPSPSHSHNFNFFDNLPHTTCTPSPSEINLRNYFSNPALDFSHLNNNSTIDSSGASLEESLMNDYGYQSPAIRIQQSTPAPQLPTGYNPSSSYIDSSNWDGYGNAAQQGSNFTLRTPSVNRSNGSHHRAPSTSSVGSDFSSASKNHASGNAHATTSHPADESSGAFSNHLPTPSPTQDTYVSPSYHNYSTPGSIDSPMTAHFAMKNALMENQTHGNDDESNPGFAHSSRQSVSSYGHNSPATPHGDDFDEKIRIPNDIPQSGLKFEDAPIYSNQSQYPMSMPRPQQQHMTKTPSMLSPHRSVMTERLQAANQARSQSPGNSVSRAVSPFRNGSQLAPVQNGYGSPHHRLGNVAQLREQQQPDTSSAMKNYMQPKQEPKTISPKDAYLELDDSEASNTPLFTEDESNAYSQSFNTSGQYSNFASNGESIPATNFNFSAPPLPHGLAQLPFTQQHYRPTSNMQGASDPTPEFPAHLTSMESSASDAGGPDNLDGEVRRPISTSANRGTYSCTYHGCPQRFETPQKLQKHKREGHRQPVMPTITPGVGSGMSSAELMQRNSQSGPHKCSRMNPTTGKPCNTEFSRPYDLTRHEDTIHNIRKQKVRCALCVEEKTFSRNDALTRHMRVVHPEVDFPGKNRRRGGTHD